MERFVGSGAGESRAGAGVPVSAEERPRTPTGKALYEDWPTNRPEVGLRFILAIEREAEAGVSVPTEPGAPDPEHHVIETTCPICLYIQEHLPLGGKFAPQPVPAPEPSARLLEAVQAVIAQAETDDDFDGQYVDYLVPFAAMDALRAALAATPQDPEA